MGETDLAATMSSEPAQLHRALADGSRRRLVEELRRAPHGLDAHALAFRVGLHPNTVRWHLGVLRDAGLVDVRRAARATPGRPRSLYALRPGATQRERDEHRLLAAILTGVAAETEDAATRAERAGMAWGRYLAPRRTPLVLSTDEAVKADLVTMLDEQGFAPEPDAGGVALRRCPFYDLAEQHPEVVCAVHKGLIAGALDELGSDFEVELEPFVRADLCRVHLFRRT
jgi:predicted ArsR family transcriptional regulator